MATEINAGRVAMVPKGEWSASTAYTRLDVVQYNGSSYVASQDSTGQNPSTATTYWQLLASGVDPSNYYTKNETNTKLGSKQDALVSGQNIKTVNGQSVIGAGNLELGDLFVVRMTRNNSNSVYTADKSVSEIYEASYTNGKPVIAVMRDINNPVLILSDCDPDGNSYVFSAIESNTVTTLRWQRTDDYTYELETMALQPHLVSGTNIKTVNNESLLGSGNVDIVGKSAYQSYVDTTTDSPVKTEAEWVASLKGEDGVDLGEVAIADNLTSNDATKVLSAKQGYILGQKINDVDNVPTAGSEKFVKSGGVQNELALGAVYDVSVKNPTAGQNNDGKFESLSALLSDANLNTLIPTAYRKGGMSIKFVQSSDNKYVQYRYQETSTVNADFTNVVNWYKTENNVDADSGLGNKMFDLDFADESGEVLLRLSNGNIKTKDFDSTETPSEYHTSKSDLDIVDKDGYVLLRLSLGHIFTKNFNSMSGGGSSEGGQWDDKIWYAYGTSLTENTVGGRGHYTDVVAQLSNLQQINKGIGGGGITDYSNKSVYNAVINPNDGKTNADIITLEVGANDAGSPIGTIYDETTSTFCGALNLCIRALQTLTTAQIVVISSTNAAYNTSTSTYATPSTQYGPDNHTKYDQWKATEEVCKINSVYYVPMGEDGGLGYARLIQDYDGEHLYIEDAIHHTPLGALILGKFVWERIKMIPTFK